MLGATAKGRSSSKAICRVLQGSLGYILGGGLYPGGLHAGSQLNRCDGPSRNRPVPPPSKEIPEWLVALRDHDFAGGDVERSPGPAARGSAARVPRGSLDFSVRVAPATAKRMSSCLQMFSSWLLDTLNITLEQICWDDTLQHQRQPGHIQHWSAKVLVCIHSDRPTRCIPTFTCFYDSCLGRGQQAASSRTR